MTWLVTGGAGYIGAHVVHALVSKGHRVVVVDDLSTGRAEIIPEGVRLVRGSILEATVLDEAFRGGVSGVIHIAGYKYAGESVHRPLHTYQQNVVGMMTLLEAMERHGVSTILFSSSAAVYGEVAVPVITEDHPKNPASPYGESKLIGEWLLADQARATGLTHCSLRYFNVVGSGVPGAYDTSPYSLMSLVFGAVQRGEAPKIFGSDYPTPDGTCVRDYIHVQALADAHVVAAEKLLSGEPLLPAYNLGSGVGSTVLEVMSVVGEVTGSGLAPEMVERRAGDPPIVVASGDLAVRDIAWRMDVSLHDMVASAWREYAAAHGRDRGKPLTGGAG
jgi:UDP-glucose 4-epimerase